MLSLFHEPPPPASLLPSEAAELALGAMVSSGVLDCALRLQQARDDASLRDRSARLAAAAYGIAEAPSYVIPEELALYW